MDATDCLISNDKMCIHRICCNIDHLRRFEKKKNKDDLKKKEKSARKTPIEIDAKKPRVPSASGGNKARSKISTEKAQEIWKDVQEGGTRTSIAKKNGVSTSTVDSMMVGKSWKSITGKESPKEREEWNKADRERREKKKEEYLRRNCTYTLRSELAPEEKPTQKDLFRLIKANESFLRIPLSERDVLDEKYCIHAPRNFVMGDKQKSRSRLVYKWFVGPVDGNHRVTRLCASKKECIRPEHLTVSLKSTFD